MLVFPDKCESNYHAPIFSTHRTWVNCNWARIFVIMNYLKTIWFVPTNSFHSQSNNTSLQKKKNFFTIKMIRVKGGITIIPGLSRRNNISTSHILSFIICLIRLIFSYIRITGHLIIDWYPCHMLSVEPCESRCKFSSLPVDRKYQNGQSRNNYEIII